MNRIFLLFFPLIVLLSISCGIYTFSGSTLPPELKTLNILPFTNQTLEPNVAEQVTQRLSQEILSTNLMRIVQDNGDASIAGRITSYTNTPYTFSTVATRQVDVNQYIVRISTDISFTNNKKNEPIYKGMVTSEGIYNFGTETESIGRERAIKQLIERILQNSVQSW